MGAEEHLAGAGRLGDPEALAARLFRDMAGALELLTVYLGERLGLYQALRDSGPATAAELAARTGTVERYVRADRVTFIAADASGPGVSGQYDLVTILEALHDMSRPVDALRVARGLLREPGCVIVADEAVEAEFTAPASLEEQYHYGWSVLACLPAVMGDPDTAATGAVMRPATLRRYALEAGFCDLEALPVEAGMLRFYRLTP